MSTATQPAARTHTGSRKRRILPAIALAVVTLLLVAYLGISAFAVNALTTPRRVFAEANTPASVSLSYEDVRFPARGGDVEISGWYIPRERSDQAIILVHGKDSSRTSEFQGNFVQFAASLQRRGFAVLMIDMRGHGRSGDAHFSFGLNEQRDIQGAVDWLQGRGYAPGSIGVLGVSMGAASSILATAGDPDIGALVEDCSYAEIYPVIQQEWRAASGLPDFFLPSTILMGRIIFGYDLSASRPVEVIGQIDPRPVLIIHGDADQLIPIAHADRLQQALPSAELWQVQGATHARSYQSDPQAYVEQVATFFERSLK